MKLQLEVVRSIVLFVALPWKKDDDIRIEAYSFHIISSNRSSSSWKQQRSINGIRQNIFLPTCVLSEGTASNSLSRHYEISTKRFSSTIEDDLKEETTLIVDKDGSSSQEDIQTNDHQEQTLEKQRAIDIALTFEPSEFSPSWFATNEHVQTIGGALLRGYNFKTSTKSSSDNYWDFSYFPPIQRPTFPPNYCDAPPYLNCVDDNNNNSDSSSTTFWDYREQFETPDGDFFEVDYKYSKRQTLAATTADGSDTNTLVVMVHGLESSSCSPQMIDAAQAFGEESFDVACINFRTCTGQPTKIPGAYHLGFTDDLKHFLKILSTETNGPQVLSQNSLIKQGYKKIYLVGFSLGANVTIKALGELGSDAKTKCNVYGAAVGACPFCIVKSGPKFRQSTFNRMVYDQNFLRSLKQKAAQQHDYLGGNVPYDINECLEAQTISEFENAFIAKCYNFTDYWDYYEQASSLPFVSRIEVPTYVMNAQDDPFFDSSAFPEESYEIPLKVNYPQHGGHLGFMFQQRKISSEASPPVASWMPMELARFIRHVDEQTLYK